MNEQYGDILRKILEKNDISQKKLALEINTTEATISRYLNNIQMPRLDLMKKIADYLKVSVDLLLGREILEQPLQIAANMKKGLYLPDIDEDEKELILNTVKLLQNRRKEE